MIALATHEFVHHHVAGGEAAADEKIAQEIQNFVEQQLAIVLERVRNGNNGGVVSIQEINYLEQFRTNAVEIYRAVSEKDIR